MAGPFLVEKIISGGQAGVDRAALDVALALGIACGGWCPKGRLSQDGGIPSRYPLKETPTDALEERTQLNVQDSDGTLVLLREGEPQGGTLLAIKTAERLGRPCLVVRLDRPHDQAAVRQWIGENNIRTINIRGQGEAYYPGVYDEAVPYLTDLFRAG